MSNFPCPNKSACVCDPNPLSVLNFSSEIPDPFNFLSIQWNFPPTWIDGGTGPGPGGQPPCVCFSEESQEAADLCAKLCSYPRGNPNPPPPGPPPPPNGFPLTPSPLFFNTAQTCSHTCGDGSTVSLTVAAGLFISYNQDLVNQMAMSLACKKVNDLHLCPTPPTDNCCLNAEYRSTISIPGAATPITFTITSGSLPPGLTDSTSSDGSTLLIEGTATTAGTYPFTLMSTTADGITIISNYTIRVLGITNITSLPNAVENTPYSTQLTAVGGTAPFTFTIISGSIPGITLSTSGLLSGTPDYLTAGSYPITVKAVNSEGDSCNFDGTVVITLRPGPDWTQLVWDNYQLNQVAPNTASGSAIGNVATGTLNYTSLVPPFPSISPALAHIPGGYTGPSVTARIRLTVTYSGNCGLSGIGHIIRNAADLGGSAMPSPAASGVTEFDVVIPISVAATIQISDQSPGNTFAELNQVATSGSVSFTWAIFNV